MSTKTKAVRLWLLVATRKGAWSYRSDETRRTWSVDGPHFLGHIINHLVLDPRDGRTLLAAAKTGHLGPTVFRSTNLGRTWTEAARPPAFPKAPEGEKGRVVDHTFWLSGAFGKAGGVFASFHVLPKSVDRNTVGPRCPVRAAMSIVHRSRGSSTTGCTMWPRNIGADNFHVRRV